ncbi:MAG: SDR family oxidoreductase [Nanoarchaeota archaeon]|nr:SDR family oxidoreductase [Nanoarchaeota archaeon]
MKILITGSSGFIGKNLFKNLQQDNQVYGISRRESPTTTYEFDITNPELPLILNEINPDIIVHCASVKGGVDYSELNKSEALDNIVGGTYNLAKWALDKKRKLIHMSTDYVYPGETNNYDENSGTKPLNFYGKTKLASEAIVSLLDHYAILRTTVVFGYDPKGVNFLMQILKANEKRKIPSDQISNPTSIDVLTGYTRGVIEKGLEGIFVATGAESMSRYEFTREIARVFGLNMNLFEAVTTKELNQPAIRPLNNGVNSSRIRNYLNYNPPSVSESLELIKNEQSRNR